MKKATLSACLVVYNEEHFIKGCLDSIKEVVDDIVIVHDGSCNDKTIDIAKKYTKKIYIKPPRGSSEPYRGFSIDKASGDWILIIDADERLSKEAQKNIRKLIEDKEVDAYSFMWPYYDMNGKRIDKKITRRKKVLFRKDKYYKLGLPHIIGETRGVTKHSNYILEHHLKSEKEMKGRIMFDLKKNITRAKITAKALTGDITKVEGYKCKFTDEDIKHRKKYMFMRNFPYLAIILVPAYSFYNAFFVWSYWKSGYLGWGSSVNLPLYYFFTCLYIMKINIMKVFGK